MHHVFFGSYFRHPTFRIEYNGNVFNHFIASLYKSLKTGSEEFLDKSVLFYFIIEISVVSHKINAIIELKFEIDLTYSEMLFRTGFFAFFPE